MRQPRIDEAELATLRPVVVLPDGVSLSELAGSTLLLLGHDASDADPIDGNDLDHLDACELELPHERVIDLAHLVKWAIGNGY
jgi:hypothetical protein